MPTSTDSEKLKIKTNFKFEKEIIDPILNCIKDNQVYLTQKENLPQLAKLGYMYNTLWYAGRYSWGYGGKLWKKYEKFIDDSIDPKDVYDESDALYSACEDNPKYKIEMCDPDDDDIENYIYDAWGMHVVDENNGISYDKFHKLIYDGKELSDFDVKMLKSNKTMDEWVELLTDKSYRYSMLYPNRRSVLNGLLCTIGTGYGLSKDGFIYKESSGADQDLTEYGDWENAKFRDDIQKVVDKIMESPFVEETIECLFSVIEKHRKEKEDKDYKMNKSFYNTLKKAGLYKKEEGILSHHELHGRLDDYFVSMDVSSKPNSKKNNAYRKYYPISTSSKIYIICDPESQKRCGITSIDQSYIDASIEICNDIIEHQDIEEEKNIKYAKKILTYFGSDEYIKDIPKEIDKYGIEKKVRNVLQSLDLEEIDLSKNNFQQFKNDGYYVDFRNTTKSEYNDNNFYIGITYDNDNGKNYFPETISNSVNILKNNERYGMYKSVLDSLSKIEGVAEVLFYFSNTPYSGIKGRTIINIEIHIDKDGIDYIRECMVSDDNFCKKGFILDKNTLSLKIGNYRLVTSKPISLGSKHPSNKENDKYFSLSKYFNIYLENKEVGSFNIDERGFNTIISKSEKNKKFGELIINSFNSFKKSNPEYGTYDSNDRNNKNLREGVPLMVHDFMMYLKDSKILK